MHSTHNHPIASGNYPYRTKPLLTDMPTFWQHDPQLWFDMVDSEFSQNRITDDQAKFLAVLKHLGSHICKTISPVLRSLPATDKYCRLKEHLIKKFASSTQQKIDSLLKECKLGDKKPSELFTEMEALGQGHVPQATILLFWYRLLPNDMAIQLDDAVTRQDAQSAVEKADRIHQRLRFPDSHISAIASHDTLDDARLNQITEHLSDKILAVIESKTKPRQNRSSDSSGSHQRARSQSRTNFGPNKDLCFYHSKYKNKAKKCPDKSCAASKYEKEWLTEEKSKKSARLDMCETRLQGITSSKRLFIKDKILALVFLIDTGAEVSVLPKDENSTLSPSSLTLHAANGTLIHTYGERQVNLDFGFRRVTRWTFICADVPYPIIGADVLAHFGWLPDLQAKKLIDKVSKISAQGHLAAAPITGISLINPQHPFASTLSQYTALFSSHTDPSVRASGVFHYLPTSGDPIAQRPRRLTPEKLRAAKQQFAAWCEDGTCRPSDRPWASPIHIVLKKVPGEFRVCGDFRKLNAVTQPNKYPVPNLHDFTSILHGTCIYTTLDLYQAFNQIPMAPEDIQKTAFISPVGLFEFLFMPYGLRNASQTFQRYVNQALGDFDFVFIYIDDVLIASNSREEHELHLKAVLERLKQHNLRLNLAKCVFGQSEVVFLSHVVNANGFSPLPDKVQDIEHFPQPTNIDELRRFLGLVNFYRAFVPHAAEILAPLNKLIVGAKKKDTTPILWSPEADKAFRDSKQALTKATALGFPKENAQIRLVTDASTVAAGAVLEQQTDSGWQPLGFFSKKFTSGQRKYAPYDLELTAIFLAIRHFHHELEGREFPVYCDHKPLQYAFSQAPEHAPLVRQRQLAYI
uniref:RNA-directed DNA polymerase n=1 Tax=Trichogramma kaykai TaxID=54128 RepID=A0ABD2VXI5_9HYME